MLTGKDIRATIGPQLEAAARGEVRNTGHTMQQLLADQYGGSVGDYEHIVQCALFHESIAQRRAPKWAPPVLVSQEQDTTAFVTGLRQRIAELRASDPPEEEPWERWEREQQRVERLRFVADHEAKHLVVGLHLGCTITEAVATADRGGHVNFSNIPAEADMTVTLAGSVEEPSGIYSTRGDRDIVEALLAKKWPGAAPLNREYAEAYLLKVEEETISDILQRRWEYRLQATELLIRDGRIGGADAHEMWRALYGDE